MISKLLAKRAPYTLEAYKLSKKSIIAFTALLATIWGVFNSLIPQETGWCILASLAIIILLFSIIRFSIWYWKIIKGRMSVSIFDNRLVTIIRNDYQINMDALLHELPTHELKKFAFIMGIDRTGRLDISTECGIVHWVMKYLNENYTVNGEKPEHFMQQTLDEYINEHIQSDSLNKLPYGTCIPVELNLLPISASITDQTIPCNLILIANSRKEEPGKKDKNENVSDDGQSNIIVPTAFAYILNTLKYKGAMIGVMGTNGMQQPYQIVFSQILNQYARICYQKKACTLRHVYISIREEDYIKDGVSLSHLEKYLRDCSDYYTTA